LHCAPTTRAEKDFGHRRQTPPAPQIAKVTAANAGILERCGLPPPYVAGFHSKYSAVARHQKQTNTLGKGDPPTGEVVTSLAINLRRIDAAAAPDREDTPTPQEK